MLRFMTKISFLIAFASIVIKIHAQDFPEFDKLQYLTPNDTLLYRLLKPVEQNENARYPLVIFLHGSGERGNDNVITLKHIAPLFLKESNRLKYPCFVVVPQCPANENWTYPDWYHEPGEPMSSVVALLDSLKALPFIDSSRIYLTGLSMGGYGTWYLLTKYPETFAAAVPICGGGDIHQVENFKHVPIWNFHGAKDDAVPVERSRSMIRALKDAGGKPAYTEYRNTGHESWVNAYAEPGLLPWIFSQKTAP
jgi:predicted peptidase